MGSIGTAEIMIVLVAALLILGPKKLPDAARQVGKAVSEFRRMATGFQDDMKQAFSEEPPSYPTALEPSPYEPPVEGPAAVPESVPPITDPFLPGPGPYDGIEPMEPVGAPEPDVETEPAVFAPARPSDTELPTPPDDSPRS